MSKIEQFYIDNMIVQTLLSSEGLTKEAQEASGLVSSLASKVKDYVADKIVPGHEWESVINILTPGILMALNFPILAFAIKIAEMYFGLDPGKILMSAVDKIKSFAGSKITSEQVDHAVNASVQENYGSEPTQADFQKFPKSATIRDAQIVKIALTAAMAEISFEELVCFQNGDMADIKKRAQIVSSFLRFVGLKSKTSSLLGKIIGWIIKVALASAGFMVVGDLFNKVVGRTDKPSTPSGLPGMPGSGPATPVSLPKSTQTSLKVNPNYMNEKLNYATGWIEMVSPEQIGDQIVHWAENIYPDLQGDDSAIRSSPGFNKLVEIIKEYNEKNTTNITFMPKIFHSRKDVVDVFIDDVAKANNGKSGLIYV